MAIRTETRGRIAIITIDRTERRNALNSEAIAELDAAITELVACEPVCLVFRGEGGHFCAGADIKELEDLTFDSRLRVLLDRIASLGIVTVASISGACMGLGMQLALACDVRVATDDAYFGIPAAKLGLIVNHWTLQRLALHLGHGAARLMVLTAATLDAEDAWRLGFIQVRGGIDAAIEIGERVGTLAPLSVSGTKIGLNLLERQLHEPAFEEAFRVAWTSEDLAEGQLAFSERRAPVFRGR